MKPKISIIVPVYNAETYIGQSLDSLLNQNYDNLEIIVVDDASIDGSLSVISRYAQADPRIIIISKKHNEGVSLARNAALERVTGDYVLFVDGDDWIEPNTCLVAVETAEQHNADVVMWSYIREIGIESRPKQIFTENRVFDDNNVREQLYRRMVGAYGEVLSQPENADALCTVWGKLYRREIIEENSIRFFDIRKIGTYEDGLFNLEIFRHVRKAVFLNQHWYHYRRNQDNSLSTAYNPQLPALWKNLFSVIRQHLDNHGLDDTFYEALSNRIALSLIPLGINEVERKGGAAAIIHGIRAILRDPDYRAAIAKFDVSSLRIHWKVFFTYARMNWAVGVYLLLIIIQKLRGR